MMGDMCGNCVCHDRDSVETIGSLRGWVSGNGFWKPVLLGPLISFFCLPSVPL